MFFGATQILKICGFFNEVCCQNLKIYSNSEFGLKQAQLEISKKTTQRDPGVRRGRQRASEASEFTYFIKRFKIK